MATYEVIVQTPYGERSTYVEADTRQQAYANAGAELGGVAIDSRQIYTPEERAANRARSDKIGELTRLEGKQATYALQQIGDQIDAAAGRAPNPIFAPFRVSAPAEDDIDAIARLRRELGWD